MTDLRMFEMFYQFESRENWSITIFDIYPTIHGKNVLKCLKNISHSSSWEILLKEYCQHTKIKHLTSLEVVWDGEFTHFWRRPTGKINFPKYAHANAKKWMFLVRFPRNGFGLSIILNDFEALQSELFWFKFLEILKSRNSTYS